MTLPRREELISQETESIIGEIAAPNIRQYFLDSNPRDFHGHRTWRFFAYSYGQAFEVLWDAARERSNYVLIPPLLFVCRQSIELSIKNSVSVLSDDGAPHGHNLTSLWSRLCREMEKIGQPTSDVFSESVRQTIMILDEHDRLGDRFRYPESSRSESYEATHVDLDQLYRGHYRVITYCEAIFSMMQENELLNR